MVVMSHLEALSTSLGKIQKKLTLSGEMELDRESTWIVYLGVIRKTVTLGSNHSIIRENKILTINRFSISVSYYFHTLDSS